MKKISTDVLIIGAGLTGLTLAYYLKKLNLSVKIVEAQDRIGGRILTKYAPKKAPIELGATWLLDEYESTLDLLKELQLNVFKQHYSKTAIYEPNHSQPAQLVTLPNSNASSYRIDGGSAALINALSKKLSKDTVQLNTVIKSIEATHDYLITTSEHCEFHSKYCVSTLPPSLFINSIITLPPLETPVKGIASKTHTWMGDSIRVGFSYKTAFWKHNKTSGTIYSNKGPIQEFYDHSNAEDSLFALGGFMNNSFFDMTLDERKNLALKQLEAYYGKKALAFESYEECVWKDQKFTANSYDEFIMPHQNNGHAIYKKSYLNNRFILAGTETSSVFSGKMEGAINSAKFVFNQLKQRSLKN